MKQKHILNTYFAGAGSKPIPWIIPLNLHSIPFGSEETEVWRD